MPGVYHSGGVENTDGGGAGTLADGEDGPLNLSKAFVQLLSHLLGVKQQHVHLQYNERGGKIFLKKDCLNVKHNIHI